MKHWILPSLAVGAVVFLLTRPGREFQDKVSDSLGDWSNGLLRANRRLLTGLEQVQSLLGRFDRALQQANR